MDVMTHLLAGFPLPLTGDKRGALRVSVEVVCQAVEDLDTREHALEARICAAAWD